MLMPYHRSSQETLLALGKRARELRLFRNLSQSALAERADVSVPTIQRFESSGTATIEVVLRLARALQAEAPFDTLFELPEYTTLDEALARPEPRKRQRAPRRT